jgi:cell division protease FtsH
MSDELGLVSYDERTEQGQYLGMSGYREKNYSDETAQRIDKEVRKLMEEAHSQAKQILTDNRAKVQLMTDMLMEFETLDAEDVKEIMAGTWNIDTKHGRLKSAEDLQRKMPPTPPPIPVNEPKIQSDGSDGMQPDLGA